MGYIYTYPKKLHFTAVCHCFFKKLEEQSSIHDISKVTPQHNQLTFVGNTIYLRYLCKTNLHSKSNYCNNCNTIITFVPCVAYAIKKPC